MRAHSRVQAAFRQPQPLHRPSMHQVLLHNLVHIARLRKPVPHRFRIHHHHCPVLALVQAAGLVDAHPALQPRRLRRILQRILQSPALPARTTRPRRRRIALVRTHKHMMLKAWHIAYRCSELRPRRAKVAAKAQSSRPLQTPASDFPIPPPPARTKVREYSPMLPDDLSTVKDDMVAFIAGHGLRRMNAFIGEEVPTVVFEEDDSDGWKDFVEHAKAAGTAFLTMSEVILEPEDVATLVGQLRHEDLSPHDPAPLEDAQDLLRHTGKVGYLQLGFAHQGVMFLYETATEWYDQFQELMETVSDFGGMIIDDAEADD